MLAFLPCMKALTIAGSDSGGGAGIQADLKTFAALGIHGSSVITAITAQNSKEVTAVCNTPLPIIKAQIDAVLSDIGCDAIKIGMLSNAAIIATVASCLKDVSVPIVLDPVMVAASGAKLLEDSAIAALKKSLFPLATLVTPNVHEASVLVGYEIQNRDDMKKAAVDILKLRCKSALMKGSHLNTKEVLDYFTDGKEEFSLTKKRIPKEGHGTGCTLSSAIPAYLAKGESLADAVKKAITYTQNALEHGYKAGSQNYVLNHFWQTNDTF